MALVNRIAHSAERAVGGARPNDAWMMFPWCRDSAVWASAIRACVLWICAVWACAYRARAQWTLPCGHFLYGHFPFGYIPKSDGHVPHDQIPDGVGGNSSGVYIKRVDAGTYRGRHVNASPKINMYTESSGADAPMGGS